MMIKIVKVIVFIFLLLFCDYIAGLIFNFLQNKALECSPGGMVPEYTVEKLNSEIVIIGSSRASHHYVSSILEDSLGCSVYNCGNDGNFFYYQTCMIDAILRRYIPKKIIWDLDPALLSAILGGKDELEYGLGVLCPLYHKNEYIDSILYMRGKFEKIKLKCTMYRYNSRLVNLLYRAMHQTYLYDRGYIPLEVENDKYPSIQEDRILDENYSNEREILFMQVIKKCIESNVKIVFCISPKLAEDNYRESKSYQTIVKIAKENDIRLIDFFHDESFMKDSTLFMDNNHLNDKGAKKYTIKILPQLKNK